jgi:hypothetical protein
MYYAASEATLPPVPLPATMKSIFEQKEAEKRATSNS